MKNQLYRLRFLGIVFVYFIAACFTFVDKLTFIDNWELGINTDYWQSNTGFLSSVAFWFNMFLFSILPVIIAALTVKDNLVTYSVYALPLYWGYIFYLSITDTGSEADVFIPDVKYFIYAILLGSTTFILVKLMLIIRSLRVENTIEELEKFKKRALRKLSKLNPNHNQKLLEDLMGSHGEALNLLMAANFEKDEEEKAQMVRLALNCVSIEEEAIETLQKRMQMYSTIRENRA